MGVENERKGKIIFGFVFYLNKLNFFKSSLLTGRSLTVETLRQM